MGSPLNQLISDSLKLARLAHKKHVLRYTTTRVILSSEIQSVLSLESVLYSEIMPNVKLEQLNNLTCYH